MSLMVGGWPSCVRKGKVSVRSYTVKDSPSARQQRPANPSWVTDDSHLVPQGGSAGPWDWTRDPQVTRSKPTGRATLCPKWVGPNLLSRTNTTHQHHQVCYIHPGDICWRWDGKWNTRLEYEVYIPDALLTIFLSGINNRRNVQAAFSFRYLTGHRGDPCHLIGHS